MTDCAAFWQRNPPISPITWGQRPGPDCCILDSADSRRRRRL